MELSKQDITDKIRSCGLKPTSQRIAILMELLTRKDHPSAEALYRSLKDEFPSLSINTIYLNLESFAEKGIIAKVNILHEAARFDGDSTPHHHFACVLCKKIVDLHNLKIPKFRIPKEIKTATIYFQQLRINGICEKCKNKQYH